jgi:hypothetical protein
LQTQPHVQEKTIPSLKSYTEPQANCAARGDSFGVVALNQLAEAWVVFEVAGTRRKRAAARWWRVRGDWHQNRLLAGRSGDGGRKKEIADLSKRAPTASIVKIWRKQRVIEDVVYIGANVGLDALCDREALVQT